VFLPLQDGVALRRLNGPVVTWLIIAANIIVHLLTLAPTAFQAELTHIGFGAIPSVITGRDEIDPRLWSAPGPATLVTSQYLHGDWFHLLTNMLFLFIFGDNVEDAMGHVRFLVFYTICGILGALAFVFLDPAFQGPLIGASGAISGVVAAYLMLHPQVRIFGLAFNIIPIRIKALYVLGAWLIIQVVYSVIGADDNVAYVAHLGGAIAGAVLIGLFKARDVRLLSRIGN
jgi:membrane associated rhomboid family serine protease